MSSKIDPSSVYQQLGRLLETAPTFEFSSSLSKEQLVWIGRAHALIEAGGDTVAAMTFDLHAKGLGSHAHESNVQKMMIILHTTLAKAELSAPSSAKGSFIPVGNSFDALAAVSKLFQEATADILLVDPYMDETVLTDFAPLVPEMVRLRLLSDELLVKPSLQPAAKRWITQYASSRKLEVRLAPGKTLHDRAILIDATTTWVLTQSLKDFAKRSPAEIVRADDTAALKINAYEHIWKSAKPLT